MPCFFKQALTAARIAKLSEKDIIEVLNSIALHLPQISLNSTPPEIGMMVYKTIYHVTGIEDPFREIKKECTKQILSIYPELKKKITSAKDPLFTALKFAALGNSIDFGATPDFDLKKELKTIFDKDFDECKYDLFKESLNKAKKILYIADNAGETVLDKLLIEQINKPIKYAVRSKPIINDATIEDAHDAGIDEIAEIVSSGCDAPGTILDLCSDEFKKIYKDADLIISKGQGNYETLSGQTRPIFFLLKVKCPVIARDIDIKTGSIILIKNKYAG
ncbi:DUF89 family protein [candidate division WOR-3 bacterium]|nr:DUF89 family protein [candidate division WOR-3 bacterium]